MENWGHSPMGTLDEGVTIRMGEGGARAGAGRGRHLPRGDDGGGSGRLLRREADEVMSILRGARS